MRGYERDEYEDLDEYEESDDEHEEEEEEEGEEIHQPTPEELEYLELRQRLKDSIRKQMKKELGTSNAGSRDKTNSFRKDNYGSFFGPSQPVIAQRVIQESKSLLENPNLAARIKPNQTNNKSSVSAPARSKPGANHRPKITNGLKKKVEILKNTRDYSFLLSEDAEIPASIKTPAPRNVTVPKSEAWSAQPLPKSKHAVNHSGKKVINGYQERKKELPGTQTKANLEKMAPTNKLPTESKKQLGSNNGSGPGRPVGPKLAPSKSPVGPTGNKGAPPIAKNSTVSGAHKPPNPSFQKSVVRKPIPSGNLKSGVQKPTPSLPKKSLGQRKDYQETSRPKVAPKQALPSSRENQVKQRPPNISSRNERPKAKPGKRPFDEDSDGDQPIDMIRKMFRYNPNRYQDADDDSDMEANFDDIMREERRSAKIAQKEDEEQLRLLEEEERRKQMRLAKKRKLGHS